MTDMQDAASAPADTAPDTCRPPVDPDDTTVVPAALQDMVHATRHTYQVMQRNSCYPAVMAVGAVEDATATLTRIGHHLGPYVGDYSRAAAASVAKAEDLLGQAVAALCSARHQLVLDEMVDPDLGVSTAASLRRP